MNLDAIKRNTESEIAHQKRLAESGEEFSAATIMKCERDIRIVDEIVPQITEEEWSRIDSGIPGLKPSADWNASVKDIKERLDLSWNEMRMLQFSRPRVSEAQKKASAKYDKANTKQVVMKLNKTTDADILEHLAQIDNVQGYIKSLIRKDIG